MSRKPRILFCSEASYLATGYATYTLEVLKRLHATGKYELCEYATYGDTSNPADDRWMGVPWKFIPVMPNQRDENEVRVYNHDSLDQFGRWKFERACLEFRPDVVCSIRDHWMDAFIERSPFRPYFHWVHMPTVDAEPQKEEWISTYLNADAVFTYSDWAIDVLNRQSQGRIKVKGSTPPGADLETLQIVSDRRRHREQMGIDPEALIVGTVMRNQSRKLYPDLIEAFAQYLREVPPELARKTYLYLHTAWPDLGWNIPRLIKEAGVGHRCLFTYFCRNCGCAFSGFFADAKTICRQCGEPSATFPKTQMGVSRKVLAQVYGLFDVYTQYSNCLRVGTEVMLRRGWTAIEKVVPGDMAYTHKGQWKPVVRVFRHRSGDRPVDVSIYSDFERLTVTSEHPVFAITAQSLGRRTTSVREQLGNRLRNGGSVPEPQFVAAGALEAGDLLAYRIDDTVIDVTTIDISDYLHERDTIKDSTVTVKYGNSYPRFISVDNEFCTFLGLYAADGTTSLKRGSVRITSNIKDDNNHALALRTMKTMSEAEPTTSSYRNRRAVNAEMYSTIHSRMMMAMCGSDTDKRLPEWTLRLPHEKQKRILSGLFMGDGHYLSSGNVSIYVTISLTLARQVKELLRRNRLDFNVRIVEKGGNRKPQYRFEVPGDVSSMIFMRRRSNSASLYNGCWHFMKVKAIEPSSYVGEVYNFEVGDDNSYMTRLGVVHNSEGFGMPLVEAAACGVPVMAVDYSAMSDVVRKLKGTLINVQRFYREPETQCRRALPDNTDLVRKLVALFSKPEGVRRKLGYEARKAVETHYTYDRTATLWEEHLDTVELRDETWPSPAHVHTPNLNIPDRLSDEAFVRWAFTYVAGRPDLLNSHVALGMVRDLTWGMTAAHAGGTLVNEDSMLSQKAKFKEFGREQAVDVLLQICEQRNHWERERERANALS